MSKNITLADKGSFGGKDIVFMFYLLFAYAIGMMCTQLFFMLYFIKPGEQAIQYPIKNIIESLGIFMGIYTGVEGGRSFLKTVGMEKGQVAKLPDWKIHQMFSFIISFAILTLLSAVFQAISGSAVNFETDACTQSLTSGAIIYVLSRTGGKLGENFDFLMKRDDSNGSDSTTETVKENTDITTNENSSDSSAP